MTGSYKKILFCTDFSENALCSFAFAVNTACHNPGVKLILLHVIPEPDAQFWKGYIYEVGDMDAKAKADIDAAIARDYRPLVPQGVDFEVAMRIGEAPQEILRYAKEADVDLIVLGRQGKGMISQWLTGNVTARVVRKAVCPVLVVPMAFVAKQQDAGQPAQNDSLDSGASK